MKLAGSITARELVIALGVAAIGVLGAVPGARGEPDPLALLAWLALIAPACGFACGALRLSIWPAAAVVPATWMLLVGITDAVAQHRDLPRPVWAACALAGMFAAGFGIGRCSRPGANDALGGRRAPAAGTWRGTALVLVVTATACALPLSGAFLRRPWPPAVNARLLDLSPATLVAECAGVDWMRHPAIYDAASTSDIDPSLRSAYDGRLAGGIVFVVGCALALGLQRFRDRRWPSTATSAPSRRS